MYLIFTKQTQGTRGSSVGGALLEAKELRSLSVSLHTPRETAAARRKRGLLAVAACCGPGPPGKEKPACSPLLPAAAAHLHLHLHGAAAAPPVSQTGRAGRHLIRGKNAAFS